MTNSIRTNNILTIVFLITLCLTGVSIIHAQNVVSAGTSSGNNTSVSLSYTIGQTVNSVTTGKNTILTQGIQQPNISVSTIKEKPGLDFSISVFPNPTTDIVKLLVEKDKIKGIQYQLYDMNGSLLQQKILLEKETEISFLNLSNATYLIKVIDGKKEVKTFKIVKN